MSDVVALYGEDYFENPAFNTANHDAYFGYMDYLRDRTNIQMRLRQVLERIEHHEPRGKVLDVGCGLGLFVEVAALNGWDASGVDLNTSAVTWAQEHVSDKVRNGTVENVGAPDGFFDCVTMFDIIEHLNDPRKELDEIWRVLRPGGLLVIITPDAGALVSRALGAKWLEMKRAPEHLHFFTMEGLAQMLGLCGFSAFEWHSIGKITTLRTVLADLRFYSARFFGAVERMLDRLGLADRVVDIDPRTKLCLYARKTGTAQPLDRAGPLADVAVPRVRRGRVGRVGMRAARASASEPSAEQSSSSSSSSSAAFRSRQHRYWESKERFLDPRLPGPAAFAVPKLDWIQQWVPIDLSTSVLDVGAGNGTLTWPLARRAGRVVGVDFSTNLLSRSPCTNPMVLADAARLPFGDDCFDVVIESNFLHHVAVPEEVLREMARVARRHVVLIEPNRWHVPMSVFMALKRSEWRGLQFDLHFVRGLAGRAGLRVVAAAPQGAVYPNQTPARALSALARFDRPGVLGAYVVAVLEPCSVDASR